MTITKYSIEFVSSYLTILDSTLRSSYVECGVLIVPDIYVLTTVFRKAILPKLRLLNDRVRKATYPSRSSWLLPA